MCGGIASSVVGTVLDQFGASNAARAARQQQQYEAALMNNRAAQAENEARQTEMEGAQQEQRLRQQAMRRQGALRSRLAASGVEMDAGSAQDVQVEERLTTEDEVLGLQSSTRRKADLLRRDAANDHVRASSLLAPARDDGALRLVRTGLTIGSRFMGED